MKINADIVSGMLLVLLGAGAALYASVTLDLGAVRRMGPAAFPAASGIILACLGLAIAIPGFKRAMEKPDISWFRLACICAGMVGFAFIVPSLGLVPAISWLTFLCVFASGRLSLGRAVAMSAALSAIAYVVFVVAFEASIPLVDWPRP